MYLFEDMRIPGSTIDRIFLLSIICLSVSVLVTGLSGQDPDFNVTEDGEGTAAMNLDGKYILWINPATYEQSALTDSGISVRYEYNLIDAVAVTLPGITVDTVTDLPGIEDIEPDRTVSLEPPIETGAGGGGDRSYDATGANMTIAVLDTGIDTGHTDLEDEVIDQEDFTGDGPMDRNGHGTHVADIAAGDGDGNAAHHGVAPEASLMNVKVLGDDGQGSSSDIVAGIEYAVENGADLISMSLGAQTRCDGSDAMSRAVDAAVEDGVLAVVAAGNEGPEQQTITAPGCAQRAFTVGATERGQIAGYSSRGPTADERMKPDLVAPGTGIVAAQAQTRQEYTEKSGTSMATPYVVGGLALVYAADPGHDPSYYTGIIEDTTYSVGSPDYAEGNGRINITAALETVNAENHGSAEEQRHNHAEDDENVSSVDSGYETQNKNGQTYYVYNGTNTDGEPIRIWMTENGTIDRIETRIGTAGSLIDNLLQLGQRLIAVIQSFFS